MGLLTALFNPLWPCYSFEELTDNLEDSTPDAKFPYVTRSWFFTVKVLKWLQFLFSVCAFSPSPDFPGSLFFGCPVFLISPSETVNMTYLVHGCEESDLLV